MNINSNGMILKYYRTQRIRHFVNLLYLKWNYETMHEILQCCELSGWLMIPDFSHFHVACCDYLHNVMSRMVYLLFPHRRAHANKADIWSMMMICWCDRPEPLFTKRTDVLSQDLVKSRSRKIGCYNDRIVLKSDRHLGSAAAEMTVKFQSDCKYINPNLSASRLYEILRYDVRPLSE